MGEVIRSNAATSDIISDLKTTLRNAQSRGGKWQELAEARLVAHLAAFDTITTQHQQAERERVTANAAVDVQNDRSDTVIGGVSDELWNALGRPGYDLALSTIFPGGIRYYTEGPDEEQPDRMALLADLIDTVPAPRLDASVRKGASGKIREAAAAFRQAITQAIGPRQRTALLERTRVAFARVLQAELVHLKRLYKAEGFSEADIHSVIPDRPTLRAKKSVPQSATAP